MRSPYGQTFVFKYRVDLNYSNETNEIKNL